jgi:hypothetical protein
MMIKSVGDKSSFALECVVSLNSPMMGRVFMYVNNKKFGQDHFDEELDAFFFRVIKNIKSINNEFPELFSLTAREFMQLIDCIYEDFCTPLCNKFKEFEAKASLIDWNGILRVEYAFDDILIGHISTGRKEKIIINQDDVLLEVEMACGNLESQFLNLASSVLPIFDWHKITCDTRVLHDINKH